MLLHTTLTIDVALTENVGMRKKGSIRRTFRTKIHYELVHHTSTANVA